MFLARSASYKIGLANFERCGEGYGIRMDLSRLDAKPFVREGVSERLVHHILGMIKIGNLNPGDKLPGERELAKAFDVSRPTVREALRALGILGVLNIRHGGGIYVSSLEGADLLGPLTFFLTLRDVEIGRLYEARRLIEGEIAALAVAAVTDADVEALEALIDEQQAVVDAPADYRTLDTGFHRRLADLSGNPFLSRAAESLNLLGQEFRKIASETPDMIGQSVRDHRRIVTAIGARDAAAARHAMEEHMMHVLNSTKNRGPMEGGS